MGEGNNLYFENKEIANQLAMYVTDMMTQKERLNFQSFASSSSKFKAFSSKLNELWENFDHRDFIINKFLVNSTLKRNGYLNEDINISREALFEIFPSDDITFEGYVSADIKKRIRSNTRETWELVTTGTFDSDDNDVSEEENEVLDQEEEENTEDSIDDLVTEIIEDMDDEDDEDEQEEISNIIHINVGDEDTNDAGNSEDSTWDKLITDSPNESSDGDVVVERGYSDGFGSFRDDGQTEISTEKMEERTEIRNDGITRVSDSDNISNINIHNHSIHSDILTYDTIVFKDEEVIKFFCPTIIKTFKNDDELVYNRRLEAQFISGYDSNNRPIVTKLAIEPGTTCFKLSTIIKQGFISTELFSPITYSINIDGLSEIQVAKELRDLIKIINPNVNPVVYIINSATKQISADRNEMNDYHNITVNDVLFAHDINQSEEYLFHSKINGMEFQYITIENGVYPNVTIETFKEIFELRSIPKEVKVVNASLRSLIANEVETLKQIKERTDSFMAKIEKDVRGKLDTSIYLT